MFKKIIVLSFFLSVFFFNFTLCAEEKQQKNNTQILYLIRVDEPNVTKNYKILINNCGWFKNWQTNDATTMIELGQEDGFVKPSYVKKTKTNKIKSS
tara:strand:- start:538 stop:828 length:291 start_codon:yes stop_codon:yes gene_type:complete